MDDAQSPSFLIKLFKKKKCSVFNDLLFEVKIVDLIWCVANYYMIFYHVHIHYSVSFLGVSREPQTNQWEIKVSYS